jgi:hypothetical protein
VGTSSHETTKELRSFEKGRLLTSASPFVWCPPYSRSAAASIRRSCLFFALLRLSLAIVVLLPWVVVCWCVSIAKTIHTRRFVRSIDRSIGQRAQVRWTCRSSGTTGEANTPRIRLGRLLTRLWRVARDCQQHAALARTLPVRSTSHSPTVGPRIVRRDDDATRSTAATTRR